MTAAHQKNASDANVVRTCAEALKLSAPECRLTISCFCSFMRLIDDTNGYLGFELQLGKAAWEVGTGEIVYQLFRAGDISSQSKDLLLLLLTQGFSTDRVLDAMLAEFVRKIAARHSETARDFCLRAIGYLERSLNHRFFERGQKVAQIVRLGNHLG